jgi:branched-chain amino acid transport system substrate-binding protein
VAPLLNQAKIPCLLFNASASAITPRSPWFVRTSFTQWQINQPLGEWAAGVRGYKRAYVLVADFAPGHEAQEAFTKGFTGKGGEILGAVRMPIQRPDFVPFLLRAKEAKPDVLFVFHPGGVEGSAFLKAYAQSGLREEGVQLIGTSDLTGEDELPHSGRLASGVITAGQYSLVGDRPANRRFVEAWRKAYPDTPLRPTYNAVGAWDGMHAICSAIAATDGKADAVAAMKVLANFATESPRGPISIDPETRDIVQNVYIREVRAVATPFGDEYGNVEFDVVPRVKDPWKASNPG